MTEDKNKEVLDSEPVKLTRHGDVTKSRVPVRWLKRPDLKGFFAGDLEVRLVLDLETREKYLEIRRLVNGQG